MNKQMVKIVVIGGGSGSSVVLRGLKQYTDYITAIVTVADDGGSSGKLREDLGMLPPGDIRNAIVALSNVEPVMAELMQHRFKSGEFSGHSLGNMIIAGLVDMTGGFEEALAIVHKIFAVTGRVLPVSLDDIVLYAELSNGNIIRGESNIPNMAQWNNATIKRVFIEPASATPLQSSVKAIEDADIILIGPGSLYTSIMPNLLIDGIKQAIIRSNAKKIVAVNLMTQPGETDQMDVADHLSVIVEHLGAQNIDYALMNNGEISEAAHQKYAAEQARLILPDDEQRTRISGWQVPIIEDIFVEEYAGYVRHNAKKLSETILNLVDTVKYIK